MISKLLPKKASMRSKWCRQPLPETYWIVEVGFGFGISTVGTGPSSMIKSKSITASFDFPRTDGAAGLAAGFTGD